MTAEPSRLAIGLGLLAALALAACQCPSATPDATTPVSPAPSVGPESVLRDCPPLELRSPSGQLIDLTGIWQTGSEAAANVRTFQMRQLGSCVFWSSTGTGSQTGGPGTPASLFEGVLHSDFTLVGDYVEVPPRAVNAHPDEWFYGTYSFALTFSGSGPAERVELDVTDWELPGQPQDFVGANILGSPLILIADADGNPIPSSQP